MRTTAAQLLRDAHRRRSVQVFAIAVVVGLAVLRFLTPSPAGAAVAISGLHVSGNQVVNAAGQPVRLLGVNRSGTEYRCIQNTGLFDGPNDATSVQAIAAWHTTVVRVPLNEDCWLAINGAPAAFSGATYQQAIVNYVNLLNQTGLVAIIDLHWNGPGTSQATGQLQMADLDHAPAFWTSVANTFKSNSSVIFDLYNEPHDISWACWKNGGSSCSGVNFSVAGMQTLVTSVRNTGATNVLMLGGLAFSNDLSQWLANAPSDPLNNLAASWHVYNFNACSNVGCYDSQAGPVLQRVPIVAGEIGENDCAHGHIDTLMAWLDAHGGSYLGWAWDTYNCNSFPALITDYTGNPTAFGIGLKNHLAAVTSGTPTSTPVPAATPTPTLVSTATPTRVTVASATPTRVTVASATPTQVTVASATPTRVAATATATPPVVLSTATPTRVSTATPTPSPGTGGGNVTATGSVASGSGPYWAEEDLTLANTAPMTALSVTVTVQKTAGIAFAGQYSNFAGGMLQMGHTDSPGQVVYTYSLAPGQSLPAGSAWRIGSQFSGNGTAHATSGDTFTITATAGGATTTSSGHF